MNKIFTLLLSTLFIATFAVNQSSAQITDIPSIKALYTTAPGLVLPSAKLSGVVISDTLNKNISKGDVILQCGNRGISVYFGVNTYALGDSLNLDITGDSLVMFKNSFEIKRHTGATNPAPVASGIKIIPATMTLQSLIANIATTQCTLVQILNATATPAGTYSGSKTLTDASGTAVLYTATAATFAATTMPTTAMNWVGYTLVYNTTNEFAIRNLTDVTPILPLSFKSFSADTKDLTATLKWNTVNEINLNDFVVEKSNDGIVFTQIGTLSAKGASSNSYVFTDATNRNNTVVYYRLKSTDKDAKYGYSNIIKVGFTAPVKFTLYPNPAVNTLNLKYSPFGTVLTANIISAQGKLIRTVVLPEGSSATSINVADLSTGVYQVTINGTENKETFSFIKK